jgi:hypothetical protein
MDIINNQNGRDCNMREIGKRSRGENITIPISTIEMRDIEAREDHEKMEEIRRKVKCLISQKGS